MVIQWIWYLSSKSQVGIKLSPNATPLHYYSLLDLAFFVCVQRRNDRPKGLTRARVSKFQEGSFTEKLSFIFLKIANGALLVPSAHAGDRFTPLIAD